MFSCNQTSFTKFLLVGLDVAQNLKPCLFFMFLVIYIITITGNLLIIVLFLGSQNLQSPMYFFLSHLSLTDILLSTNVVPILLYTLLWDGLPLTVAGCVTQYLAIGLFSGFECILLTIMSYDRYLAVCNPLRYMNIMTQKLCVLLVTCTWGFCVLFDLMFIIQIFLLDYCECTVIDYIYCDSAPLLEVSCSETSTLELEAAIFSIPIIVLPFLFVIVTYVNISQSIIRISSSSGKQKAFSTCSSHLTVVCTYYGIMIAKYTVPVKGQSLKVNKVVSVLYTIVTPLFNPIIYSLRNLEIRKALFNKIIKN